MQKLCPCTSGQPYHTCCQPYHKGRIPPTAVALMRSRYAAYALGKIGYILKTEQLPANQPDRRKAIKQFCQNTDFIGLQILAEETLAADQATVTFRAIMAQHGQDASFTERSLFAKRDGRWLYIDPL
ncbi:MAG: hypothetical protein HF973_09035 [Chloroflexi bacterium]|nr:hypothetical protein [Chloroflexota bacterium]